ncbi:MAG: RNA polymerase sigma factor [Bacteroidales bacterium]|jgi:RNA polymerase sigma-70 factor (ECF subfamily)|nr:RNA polymerase sigma factor [Bacteroidales bacterium]
MTPGEFREKILPQGRRLYALAWRFLNSREEAEDAVQEVMMKLWEERAALDRRENLAAWCTTVTRNCCIDILRKRKRVMFGEMDEIAGVTERGADPAASSDNYEAAQLISMIVSRMKEPYRSALILRDMEGYSYEETAKAMNSNVNALRTTLSRARKAVREEMKKIYDHGTG